MAAKKVYRRTFIDSLRLHIKAGSGGNGFPKYGGIGGKGGDVYITGVENQTLSKTQALKKSSRWKAGVGKPSAQFRIYGDAGEDLIIPAPLGTTIKTDLQQTLGDIIEPDDTVLVARGGAGGTKDNQFAGQKGETHHVQLLLKLIADVGLLGFPNAGKSTFLRAVSHAKPKVASYPFTTLHPSIGLMRYEDSRQVSVADLPGLIEGAWSNAGMGHRFLRHVERTKVLLFLVDVDGFRLGPKYPQRTALQNIILLNRELELYEPDLVDKPAVLLVNKMDRPGAERTFDQIRSQLENMEEISRTLSEESRPTKHVSFGEVLQCSAKYDRDSVQEVKERLRRVIDLYADDNPNKNHMVEVHDRIKEQLHEQQIKLV